MGKIHKVTVTMVEDDEYVGTVLELAAPVDMLRQFAPAAVAAALGVTAQVSEPPRMAMDVPANDSDGPKERRRRRTKAEMEAARAAEAAGAPANDPLHTAEDQAAPTPPDEHPAGGGRGPEPEKYNPFG